jgi:hypothetical protein
MVMTDLSLGFGLSVALGYFLAVIAGIPLSLAALVLTRWVDPTRALGAVALLPAVGLVVLAVLTGRAEDPFGALPGVATVGVVLAFVWGVPLLVGLALLVRFGGRPARVALRDTRVGLPVGLLGSVLVFVAPGGTRYNILFLDGVAAVLAWMVFLSVLVFGPTLAGVAVARIGRGRKKVAA